MPDTWTAQTTSYLQRPDVCPRRRVQSVDSHSCSHCGAELDGPAAADVVQASVDVVRLLAARERLIGLIPTVAPATVPAVSVPAHPGPFPIHPSPGTSPVAAREGSRVTVQSVLAVAGAGLLAIAAIVFTFFNPDLTSFSERTTIVAATTVVFLGASALLTRVGLRFSAEAVGALGVVFVGLDVWAFASIAPDAVDPLAFAGLGQLICSIVLLAVAVRAKSRSWLWTGMVGLVLTPLWFGYAVRGVHADLFGWCAVTVTVVGAHLLLGPLRRWFGAGLDGERLTIIVVQGGAAIVAGCYLWSVGSASIVAGVFALFACVAAVSSRFSVPRLTLTLAGVLGVASAIALAFTLNLADPTPYLTLVPLSGAAALMLGSTALRVARPIGSATRDRVIAGGWALTLATIVPALAIGGVQLLTITDEFVPTSLGIASAGGIAAVAIGSIVTSRFADGQLRSAVLIVGLWLASAAAATTADWSGLGASGEILAGILGSIAVSVALLIVAPAVTTRTMFRAPLIVGAHALAAIAAVVSIAGSTYVVAGGIGALVSIAVVARIVPSRFRPLYLALGFAYALLVFARALTLADLDTIAVLCLTTSLASIATLAATLTTRIGSRFWYAMLAVTAVPFLIGIASVLSVRSGWTALSTGLTFALALALVISRRDGLHRLLRAAAAAILVPALAVVVICLGAQILVVSASPITLPIIAVAVSCALASTGIVDRALVRRGIERRDARLVRLAIEASSLVTAALTVVLALARAAAGLDTSFLVLAIIGTGAAATAILARRRYAWIVAAASWTGALWSFWGIISVPVLEAYILPPALGVAIVGAVGIVLNRRGFLLYWIGLGASILPSLALLVLVGNGGAEPSRYLAITASSLLLLAFGLALSRRSREPRVRLLARPALTAAIVAAAAGPIEATRIARGIDRQWLLSGQAAIAPALALAGVATLVALVAGRTLSRRHPRARWVYMPAAAYFAASAIAAAAPGWPTVITLWGVMAALLALMLVTTVAAANRATALPPVWFTFALAWCAAVAGWSDRALRVEAFSLPLGIALLAVGVIAFRSRRARIGTATSWPIGFHGSWWLVAPGIVAILLPSMLATGTDPLTLRAVLVIGLALIAILIGSRLKLAAPFVIGLVALPIENITVFAVQAGHAIEPTSWWITLASAGSVLLVIAIGYERRDAGNRGVAARLRDLR